MSEWVCKQLGGQGGVCVIKKGTQINRITLSNEGDYYVLNGGIQPSGYHSRYNTEANTISISEGGNSCGYVAYNTKHFWSGGHNYTLSGLIIEKGYLYHYLKYNEPKIMGLRVGTGLPNIQRKQLEAFRICYPTNNNEQNRIADCLTAADEAIAVSRALIEKYAAVKQGLVHDLFNQGKREKVCLGEVTEKIADRDHTTPVYVERGVYIVSPKDFDEFDQIDFSHCAKISLHDHLINRKKTDIRSGDLIFTRIGAGLGKICIVEDGMPEFSILHSAAMIRCNSRVLAKYLMYRIKTFEVQKQIKDGIQSIGVPDLGMDKINEISFLIHPDKNEQERIVEILTAADEHLTAERERLRKLEDIKRGLMDDLLTNKVSTNQLQGGI